MTDEATSTPLPPYCRERSPPYCRERSRRGIGRHAEPDPMSRIPDTKIIEGVQLRLSTITHSRDGGISGNWSLLTQAPNVLLLGPSGTGKTHLATGLGIKAAQTGHRVAFAPPPIG